MTEFVLRRAQFISPSGTGSLQTSPDGITGIICGIDHWIDRISRSFDPTEFEIRDEWRLSETLGVDYFVRPPDFRIPYRKEFQDEQVNMSIQLPALRFPLWHWCRKCKFLEKLENRQYQSGKVICRNCEQKDQLEAPNKKIFKRFMVQVSFLAMCEEGHIQDFPFREWVHKSVNPTCQKKLSASLFGATLEGQSIKCECGAQRNLSGIFGGAYKPGTETYLSNLSEKLDPTTQYLCRGCSPWLDDFVGSGCSSQLFGGLTGAVNIYYPYVRSAIFLPNDVAGIDANLLEVLAINAIQIFLKFAIKSGEEPHKIAETLLKMFGAQLRGYTVEKVAEAIQSAYLSGATSKTVIDTPDDWRIVIKAPEYSVLAEARSSNPEMLKLTLQDRALYADTGVVGRLSSSLTLVERLRETRVLTGFGRVKPNPHLPLAQIKAMLRRSSTPRQDWLPAYEVFGEGIFIDFNTDRFKLWSQRPDVQARVAPLKTSAYFKRDYSNCKDDTFLPRFVALHTLSHILINQLVFDCGYTAASLRERLYCSDEGLSLPAMNGILIYTASGDSEGSMGGLVRMGEPTYLDRTFEAALDNARFCSSDPICMEMGEVGQGPNSMNLAACHSCALVPETSCEYFNQYLDRGLLVGLPGSPSIGFFSDLTLSNNA